MVFLARDIHRAGGVASEQRIREPDDVGRLRGKHSIEHGDEILIRRVVRPESKDASGMELRGAAMQSGDLVECTVPRVQETLRGVVDVEQDSVKEPVWILCVESLPGGGEREEIAQDQTASRVGRKLRPERNETAPVPADDGLKRLDNEERTDSGMIERGERGVPQPKATDDDIQLGSLHGRQSQIGERDFDLMEEARHEECIAQFHLEDFQSIEGVDSPAAQDQLAERGLAVVEFSEIGAHLL